VLDDAFAVVRRAVAGVAAGEGAAIAAAPPISSEPNAAAATTIRVLRHLLVI